MATMQILLNGVLTERTVRQYTQWNGYMALAIPALYAGEDIHWTAGNRIPEVRSW